MQLPEINHFFCSKLSSLKLMGRSKSLSADTFLFIKKKLVLLETNCYLSAYLTTSCIIFVRSWDEDEQQQITWK